MKTSYKRIIPIAIVAIIAVALFLGGNYLLSLAKAIYPDIYGMVDKNNPKLINDEATQIINQTESANASPSNNSSIAAVPINTPDPSAQMTELLNQLEQKTFTSPGWIHFVYSRESDVSNGVVLPDGKAMSQNYITDGWYLLNDQNLVTEDVVSMVDDSGAVLQREVYTNGTMDNLTFGEKMTDVQPYKLKLDLGVTQDMLTMKDDGAILQEENNESDGVSMIKFSIQGTYDKPTILGNSPKPVKGFLVSATYNSQSGSFMECETVWQLTDGTEVLFERGQVLTSQSDELPNDIAQILENEK